MLRVVEGLAISTIKTDQSQMYSFLGSLKKANWWKRGSTMRMHLTSPKHLYLPSTLKNKTLSSMVMMMTAPRRLLSLPVETIFFRLIVVSLLSGPVFRAQLENPHTVIH